MVTKQQQLEWLAIQCNKWPSGMEYLLMSNFTIGLTGGDLKVTRQEWQQERDKMNSKPEVDNSWHERGELPPVGCECEILHKLWKDSDWAHIVVIALTRESLICKHKLGAGEEHYYLNDIAFRPLRTEREKAIDSLIEIICAGGELSKDGSAAREIAERIHDAVVLK